MGDELEKIPELFQMAGLGASGGTQRTPAWYAALAPRDQEQVKHARDYTLSYAAAGVPGHSQFLLIAKLADLLDGHALPEQDEAR